MMMMVAKKTDMRMTARNSGLAGEKKRNKIKTIFEIKHMEVKKKVTLEIV